MASRPIRYYKTANTVFEKYVYSIESDLSALECKAKVWMCTWGA
jgi:hypothetical protein